MNDSSHLRHFFSELQLEYNLRQNVISPSHFLKRQEKLQQLTERTLVHKRALRISAIFICIWRNFKTVLDDTLYNAF